MTRKFLITAAAIAAVNTVAFAEMGQSGSEQSRQGSQQSSPTAQPAGGAMTGTQSGQTWQQKQGASVDQKQQLTDQDYVKQVAQTSQFEVQAAQLAADKIDDPSLKQSAQRIQQDHAKASDELKQIAKSKNMDVPTEMDAQHQRLYDQMKNQGKEELATSFKAQQIQAHKDAIDLNQRASTQLKDPELKEFAQKQVPILQQHLTSLQGAQSPDQAVPAGSKLDSDSKWKDSPYDKKESGYESKDTPIQPQDR